MFRIVASRSVAKIASLRSLVSAPVCARVSNYEKEFSTHYGDLDWVEPSALTPYRCPVPCLAKLGMESCICCALRRSDRALWIFCVSPFHGEDIPTPVQYLSQAVVVMRDHLVRLSPVLADPNIDTKRDAEGHDPFHHLANQFLDFFDFFLWDFK
jgi:hypothetical protein